MKKWLRSLSKNQFLSVFLGIPYAGIILFALITNRFDFAFGMVDGLAMQLAYGFFDLKIDQNDKNVWKFCKVLSHVFTLVMFVSFNVYLFYSISGWSMFITQVVTIVMHLLLVFFMFKNSGILKQLLETVKLFYLICKGRYLLPFNMNQLIETDQTKAFVEKLTEASDGHTVDVIFAGILRSDYLVLADEETALMVKLRCL